MSKIKCSQEKCKYNHSKYCMKDGIYVDKHASCDSYEEGKKDNNYKFEFGSFQRHENHIVCNATHCLYNEHNHCAVNHLNIDKERDDAAICTDFKQMD